MLNITPAVFRVRDFKPGMIITEPGIYRDVPMARYHCEDGVEICAGPSISSSGIRTIENESLLHYFDTSHLNPDREPPESKPHFSLGKAVHHLAAGEKDFREHFVVRPAEYDSWRTKKAKEWRAQAEKDGKNVLIPDDIAVIRGIAKSLENHPTIMAGILEGLIEHSIFWRRAFIVEGKRVVVWCKARPDVLTIAASIVVDLKTTADASAQKVRRSIADLSYHIQLGMVHDGILATTGRVLTDHILPFVETKRPYAINIKPLSPLAIEYGRRQLERGLGKFARAVGTDCWDGYEDDEVEADLPVYLKDRLSKEAEKGLLPAPWDGSDDFANVPDHDDEEVV